MISSNYYYSVSTIRRRLDQAIRYVSENVACYCSQPGIHFTRNRKMNSEVLIRYLIHLSDRSICSDLMNYYDAIDTMPSASAVCQQRYKLDPNAMERVFHLFTDSFTNYETYKGYYLLACDGSDITISHNPDDKDTHKVYSSATKGFNQLHLNALYDVLNGIYHDVSIDTARKTNECNALSHMIRSRRYPRKSIIICDRGYEKYNLIADCIEHDQKFIIRVKDITSNGMLSSMGLPDTEFDMHIRKTVTRVNNKETIKDSRYAVLMNNTPFDHIDFDHEYYDMDLRVIRFRITDDTYECLINHESDGRRNGCGRVQRDLSSALERRGSVP